MHTYLDCIPCIFRQALEAARFCGLDEAAQAETLYAIGRQLPNLPLNLPPPELHRLLFPFIGGAIGSTDPYREVKKSSNRYALALYPELIARVRSSATPLRTAVEIAIVGNIIDYGAMRGQDIKPKLERLLSEEQQRLTQEDSTFFDFSFFSRKLEKADSVLYLADNAGETVFDRVLLKTIRQRYPDKPLLYAVRSKPIVNDALEEDARECGIDAVAEIVSSGSDAPGTILSRCTPDFLEKFRAADIIISKGQGNYEALSGERGPICFLLVAKCPVIAEDIGCAVGDVLLIPAAAISPTA
jgi:uncharacterized protein with ATP-grasp and redox domains